MKYIIILSFLLLNISAAELPKEILGSYDLIKADFEIGGKLLNLDTKEVSGTLDIESQALIISMTIGGRTDKQTVLVANWKVEEAGVIMFVNAQNRVMLLIKTPKGCIVKASKNPDGKSTSEMEVMDYARRL